MLTHETYKDFFDKCVHMLRKNICYASQAHKQENNKGVLENYIHHSLQRLSRMYKHIVYDNLAIEGILSSAIYLEALLAHEFKREFKRSNNLSAYGKSVEADGFHLDRAKALINVARNARNLDMQPGIPFINPHLGVYAAPMSESLRLFLRKTRTLYVHWNNGILAAMPESHLEQCREIADEVLILYYDSDEMVDLVNQHGVEKLDPVLQDLLQKAKNDPENIAEHFPRHLGRRLLHQSTILYNLSERLQQEHPATLSYCEPVIAETREILRHSLSEYPAEPEALTTHEKGAHNALIASETELQNMLKDLFSTHQEPEHLLRAFHAIHAAGSMLETLREK